MPLLMSDSKVMVNYRVRQKSKMATKKAAMKAAKTLSWDNISRWEHATPFTRHLEDYKN